MSHELRLNCVECSDFTEYTHDTMTVVRCDACGKKHSDNSVWMVDTRKNYKRSESGTLLEDPI